MSRRVSLALAMAAVWLPLSAITQTPAVQEILHARYRLIGPSGPLGGSDLTEFRRGDGSRSYLSRDRMEFWGPILDRFVVLTYDSKGRFDSGHWVGTSAYSHTFWYTFRFDGRAIRGDWQDDVRGTGRTEVPSDPGTPVVGFWGPLESRVLDRFDPSGPATQIFPAVDVEDSHHRLLTVTVERLGREEVDVPAGHFQATHYRSERFGRTDHWIDDHGTVIRWASEQGTYKWDLERYPSAAPLENHSTVVADGAYRVTSAPNQPSGTVTWSIAKDAAQEADGGLRLVAQEHLDVRESRFDGVMDGAWRWRRTVETAHWLAGEGDAGPEIHHLETFFYGDWIYLLRFRDRAYPLLQGRAGRAPAPFYAGDYPISAMVWLRHVPLVVGQVTRLTDLAHISNRYRGGGLEVQNATVTYLGRATSPSPSGSQPAHHFVLRYPGGWGDATSDFLTDARFVPLSAHVITGEGAVEFRLTDYRVFDGAALRAAPRRR
jgi:hypothetical protein